LGCLLFGNPTFSGLIVILGWVLPTVTCRNYPVMPHDDCRDRSPFRGLKTAGNEKTVAQSTVLDIEIFNTQQ